MNKICHICNIPLNEEGAGYCSAFHKRSPKPSTGVTGVMGVGYLEHSLIIENNDPESVPFKKYKDLENTHATLLVALEYNRRQRDGYQDLIKELVQVLESHDSIQTKLTIPEWIALKDDILKKVSEKF